jgi:hypothetical protein
MDSTKQTNQTTAKATAAWMTRLMIARPDIRVMPNARAEAGRAKSVQHGTKAQTRPCLQHAG